MGQSKPSLYDPNSPLGLAIRKHSQGPSNEVEQELADMLSNAAKRKDMHDPSLEPIYEDPLFPNSGAIRVRSPLSRQSGLMPAPMEGGEEPMWDYMNRVVPELQGRTPRIHIGPNVGVLEDIIDEGYKADQYPQSNILGAMDRSTHDISLNPRLTKMAPHRMDSTVAHEMAHSVGMDHGRDMDTIHHSTASYYGSGRTAFKEKH